MCNWKNWIWPGIVTTALLTALTGWFLSGHVHHDLGLRAGDQLKAGQPWAKVHFRGRDGMISGVAENEIQQREAENIARSTYGVRVIENQTVLPEKADPFVLSLVKEGEGITLKGNYDSTQSRMALVAAAEKSMPGIAIKDELTLAAGKPEGFDVLSNFGLSQLADLSKGEVSLANLDYAIKGVPADLPAYEKLTAAVASLPAGSKLKSAEIDLPTLGKPYEFSGSFDGSTVNLTGYAPSMDIKSAIEAKAKELFSGKAVNSALKLAAGAPSGFADAVGFGLSQIAGLAEGAFSLSDLNYTVKGKPADTAAYEAAHKAAKESLPAGMTLAAADLVAPPAPEPTPAPAPAPEPAKPYAWSALNAGGILKLEGNVPSSEAAAAVVALANSRFVKTEVQDAQAVAGNAPEGFADLQANLLKSLSYLTVGKAVVSGNSVLLEGNAPSQSVLDLAISKAKAGIPSGYELSSNLAVAAPAAAAPAPAAATVPYEWSAIYDAAGVKLEGSVLSGAVATSIVDLAKSRFVKTEVSNAMAPVSPSPAGFAAAQEALIKGLSFLNEGKAGLVNQAATLSGVAPSESVKAFVTKKTAESLPEGYTLSGEITVAAAPPAPAPAPEAAPAPVVDPKACVASIAAILAEGQINFEVSKAAIREESFGIIGKIAEALKGCAAARIEIGGHTDSDGNDASNQVLSEARANAVRDMLLKTGVSAEGISAKGYGETQPLAANDTPDNKAKNRRIEFRLVP